ncbi:hypothetical protein R1flu_018876 [Riccia fluitans]|uniref:PRELI/MSF1 domain-containing protein n=1 Tax=Riccia fluitans TaxID=41844 RepID=A0ABD1ZH93_9MARC
MDMVSKNVTMKDFVEVEEKCSYLPHPENPDWTIFRQETNIRCATLSVLASMAERIEQKCVENFQKNSSRGREIAGEIFPHNFFNRLGGASGMFGIAPPKATGVFSLRNLPAVLVWSV